MDKIFYPLMTLTRLLLATVFLMIGASMINQYAVTHVYLVAMGLPGLVSPLVILIVVAGALALMAGYRVRWAALVLAGVSLAAAVLLHLDFGDPSQGILFIRNLLVSGVLLVLAVADSDRKSLPLSKQRAKSRDRKAPAGCCQAGC